MGQLRAAPLWQSGLLCRCPRCGTGKLYAEYLKFAPRCTVCDLDYRFADSGDGPAVFVILIAGHLAYGIDIDAQRLIGTLLVVVVGSVAFCALGFALTIVIPNQAAAPAITNGTANSPHRVSDPAPTATSVRAISPARFRTPRALS